MRDLQLGSQIDRRAPYAPVKLQPTGASRAVNGTGPHRDYETNDVLAAEDPMAFSAKVQTTICFIALPQNHRSCGYWNLIVGVNTYSTSNHVWLD
jgi:hypothetical protein